MCTKTTYPNDKREDEITYSEWADMAMAEMAALRGKVKDLAGFVHWYNERYGEFVKDRIYRDRYRTALEKIVSIEGQWIGASRYKYAKDIATAAIGETEDDINVQNDTEKV